VVLLRHHQRGQAQGVGEEDEFLALVRTHLAGLGEEADAGKPFFLGQLDLAGEGVQVLHQDWS
jgi:hypothetical protein